MLKFTQTPDLDIVHVIKQYRHRGILPCSAHNKQAHAPLMCTSVLHSLHGYSLLLILQNEKP